MAPAIDESACHQMVEAGPRLVNAIHSLMTSDCL
jgi:hypothetical protein